jgi:hypothetical protein
MVNAKIIIFGLIASFLGCTIEQTHTQIEKKTSASKTNSLNPFGYITEIWDGALTTSSFRNSLPVSSIDSFSEDKLMLASYKGFYNDFTGVNIAHDFYFFFNYPEDSANSFHGTYELKIDAKLKSYTVNGRFYGKYFKNTIHIEMPVVIDTSDSNKGITHLLKTKFIIEGTSYVYHNRCGIYEDSMKNLERPLPGCFVIGTLMDSAKVLLPIGSFLMTSIP